LAEPPSSPRAGGVGDLLERDESILVRVELIEPGGRALELVARELAVAVRVHIAEGLQAGRASLGGLVLVEEAVLVGVESAKFAGMPVNSARLTCRRRPCPSHDRAPGWPGRDGLDLIWSRKPSLFVSNRAKFAGTPVNSALLTLPSPSLSIALNRAFGSFAARCPDRIRISSISILPSLFVSPALSSSRTPAGPTRALPSLDHLVLVLVELEEELHEARRCDLGPGRSAPDRTTASRDERASRLHVRGPLA